MGSIWGEMRWKTSPHVAPDLPQECDDADMLLQLLNDPIVGGMYFEEIGRDSSLKFDKQTKEFEQKPDFGLVLRNRKGPNVGDGQQMFVQTTPRETLWRNSRGSKIGEKKGTEEMDSNQG